MPLIFLFFHFNLFIFFQLKVYGYTLYDVVRPVRTIWPFGSKSGESLQVSIRVVMKNIFVYGITLKKRGITTYLSRFIKKKLTL